MKRSLKNTLRKLTTGDSAHKISRKNHVKNRCDSKFAYTHTHTWRERMKDREQTFWKNLKKKKWHWDYK